MWYFSWILGLGLATTFAVLNAIWYDIVEDQRERAVTEGPAPGSGAEPPASRVA